MKHAFIMDPLEGVKPWKDTTYFLMLAARQRGHEVCCLDQMDMYMDHDRVRATVRWVDVHDDYDRPFTMLREEVLDLAQMDVVWIRPDPPFDRRYFYTTLLLDFLPPPTRVVNRPSGLRNWNEKLAALFYPDYTPRTLVTADVGKIKALADEVGRITVKPVDGYGGKGIQFYRPGEDPEQMLREATHDGGRWVIAQEYLPAAKDGDKRILILQGEPLGAILRLHAEGQELNNLDAGGTAHACQLDDRDREICAALELGFAEQGIFFAGIDVIGGMLVEVNVTSPTGLQELSRFAKEEFHHQIIAALE